MKKLLLSAAIVLATTGAFAQMSGNDARIGIKAGVNLARAHASGFTGASTVNDLTTDNVGYNFTVFGDFGVGKNFFIQPGVSLQNKGTKLENGAATTPGYAKVNIMAIEIPVNAVLRIPTGASGAFQISAGPYVSFNIDGTIKTSVNAGTNSGTSTRDLNFGNSTTDDVTSTDFGANFGLAYRLNNGLVVGGNYGLGLTNLTPKDNRVNAGTYEHRVLGFSVGYSF